MGWCNYRRNKKHFGILTTEANELMAEIQNIKKRMPLILRKVDDDMLNDEQDDFYYYHDTDEIEDNYDGFEFDNFD